MKKFILLLTIITVSCAQKNDHFLSKAPIIKKYNQKYSFYKYPLVVNNDTTYINELRFYKIESAAHIHKILYNNFGKWTQSMDSETMKGFPRLVWTNLDVLGDNQKFSIIADGIETPNEYYSSIIIVNSKNIDCLSEKYVDREKLIEFFSKELNKDNKDNNAYRVIREQ